MINGQSYTFRGTLALVSGDNLASHYLGGYKSLSSALRKCRHCEYEKLHAALGYSGKRRGSGHSSTSQEHVGNSSTSRQIRTLATAIRRIQELTDISALQIRRYTSSCSRSSGRIMDTRPIMWMLLNYSEVCVWPLNEVCFCWIPDR